MTEQRSHHDRGVAAPSLLVAEDEKLVRDMVVRALSEEGFSIVAADNGREALDHVRRTGMTPDLLLTDVIMPVMGGWDLAAAMKDIQPDLPVIYMSGYAGLDMEVRGLIPNGAPFLQKPFSTARLIEIVETYLPGKAGNRE
ncbi:MAG: response regulator [Gemmatimonadales bacterium]